MVNGARSIELDLYAVDKEKARYDVEVQKDNEGADPHRARYHASLIDEQASKPKLDFKDLPDIYIVFITENDVVGDGFALNPVERVYTKSGKPFNDGMHILYVNCAYKGDDEVGNLIHDFTCTDADDMKTDLMAQATRHYKEESEGVREMCKSMEQLRDESLEIGRILQTIKIYRDKLHLDDSTIISEIIGEFNLTKKQAEEYVLAPAVAV